MSPKNMMSIAHIKKFSSNLSLSPFIAISKIYFAKKISFS